MWGPSYVAQQTFDGEGQETEVDDNEEGEYMKSNINFDTDEYMVSRAQSI